MKILFSILTLLITSACFSQKERKISICASLHADKTIYDNKFYSYKTAYTGLGLQSFMNTKSLIKPTLELTADLFTVPQAGPADEPLKPKKIIVPGFYIGPSFQITDRLFLSTTLGTSIYSKQAHFGLRPSVWFAPSKRKNWAVKLSFTNVFQEHTVYSSKDFGYLSFGLNFQL